MFRSWSVGFTWRQFAASGILLTAPSPACLCHVFGACRRPAFSADGEHTRWGSGDGCLLRDGLLLRHMPLPVLLTVLHN